MKKLTILIILLIGSLSYGQEPIIIYQNAPDRQKITEFEKRNDSLVISLENSGTNKVYLGDLRTDISGKANINSPTFTGNVIVPTATISDAAVNLGQMMDSLATVGTGLIQEIASTKTLTKEDAWIVYRNRSVGDSVTYTIPNQVNGGFTEDIGYTFYTKTTGKIFVKGETGSGVEPVEISGAGQYETIIRVGENSWDWSKGVLPWNWNLYNTANALSIDNEANSLTGLQSGNVAITLSAVTSPVTDGVYAVKAVNPIKDSFVLYIDRPSGLVAGKKYRISMDISHNDTATGNSVSLSTSNQWDAAYSTNIPIAAGYNSYSITGTLTDITDADSGRVRIYFSNFYTAALDIFVDKVIWEEVNP